MLKLTKEDTDTFKEKLEYIGIDFNNIPDFLMEFKPIEYRPIQRFDNIEYYVYRFVPLQDIQILITDADRLTDIREKYEKAKPISQYLQAKTEEQIDYFTTFLNMLRNTSISDIENVQKKQLELNNGIPYEIKFEKHYIWQIYYSEYTDKYFMLVPSNDSNYEALFYLIKKQIQKENEYIYVPIANIEPGEDILTKNERIDLQKYFQLF